MAGHGNKRHWKRLAKSKALRVSTKTHRWIKKPLAGKHTKEFSIPLVVLLRDMLKVTKDAAEARHVLSGGQVFVDGVVQKKAALGVGLMDVISIPKLGKYYQIFTLKGELHAIEITAEEAKHKSCRIVNKTLIKGNKVQLNLHDGRNVLIEKEEDRFGVGDTVRLEIPTQKIDQFIKLEKGATCYVFKGKHSGKIGILEEIVVQPGGVPSQARLTLEGKQLITQKDYLFAVAKEFRIQ